MDTIGPALPEFFITDMHMQMLPGDCVRVVCQHPTEGENVALIIPWVCWVEIRLKGSGFQREHAVGRSVPLVAH